MLSSLARTGSPALAFLSAAVLWGSGAVLYALLCCGLHVRLRYQIHVCVALLVVSQLLAPAFYAPALASSAPLQRLAGSATALGAARGASGRLPGAVALRAAGSLLGVRGRAVPRGAAQPQALPAARRVPGRAARLLAAQPGARAAS